MRKKILLLVTAILVQCGVVMGQTPIETAVISDPSGEECGIVRSWKSSLAVAYHQHNGIHLFSVIDSATNTVYSTRVLTTAPIGSYTINDFRIVGDTAYCGGSVDNVAMIAYFDINDITIGGSVAFYVLVLPDIEQVTRLAAYRNSVMNGVGIAAIGKNTNTTYPNYDYYYMVECNNYGGAPFSASSRACVTAAYPSFISEQLNDVVVTRNYVGFVGEMTNTEQVCIRRGDKNGIFASTLIDTIHQFFHPSHYSYHGYAAEAMDINRIAVASTFNDDLGYSVQLFLFNLSNMSFFDAWEMMQAGDGAVNELVYIASSGTLLMEVESPVEGHRVIYTSPFSPIDYLAPYMKPLPYEDICSMDFRNSSYFILSTVNHWILQKIVYPCSPTNRCIENGQVDFFRQLVSLDNQRSYRKPWCISSSLLDKFFPYNFVYLIDCFSF